MAKFNISQGKFSWDSGSPETEAEEGYYIDNKVISELRERVDYFANTCTAVHSNLESCFNEKSAEFGNNLLTQYDDNRSAEYGIECNTERETRYDSTENALNSYRRTDNRSPKCDAFYDPDNHIRDHPWWGNGNHRVTINSFFEESYRGTNRRDNDATDGGTIVNTCNAVHNTARESVNDNHRGADNSDQYSSYNSTFDDQ